jgi:hypothetical protein
MPVFTRGFHRPNLGRRVHRCLPRRPRAFPRGSSSTTYGFRRIYADSHRRQQAGRCKRRRNADTADTSGRPPEALIAAASVEIHTLRSTLPDRATTEILRARPHSCGWTNLSEAFPRNHSHRRASAAHPVVQSPRRFLSRPAAVAPPRTGRRRPARHRRRSRAWLPASSSLMAYPVIILSSRHKQNAFLLRRSGSAIHGSP